VAPMPRVNTSHEVLDRETRDRQDEAVNVIECSSMYRGYPMADKPQPPQNPSPAPPAPVPGGTDSTGTRDAPPPCKK
jgi:hypothetical protein